MLEALKLRLQKHRAYMMNRCKNCGIQMHIDYTFHTCEECLDSKHSIDVMDLTRFKGEYR